MLQFFVGGRIGVFLGHGEGFAIGIALGVKFITGIGSNFHAFRGDIHQLDRAAVDQHITAERNGYMEGGEDVGR